MIVRNGVGSQKAPFSLCARPCSAARPARSAAIVLVLAVGLAAVSGAGASAASLQLSAEERAWLDDNPEKLVLYFDTHFPPIEFRSETGAFTGMGADVIAKIEDLLGVTFMKHPSDDWNAHLAALETGECAIAPVIVRTPEREAYAHFTSPYVTVPVVIITRQDSPRSQSLDDFGGQRVAVVSGYATEQYARDQALLTKFEVVPVENVPKGLQGVSFGQFDALVENLAVAAHYIEELGIPNLRVETSTDYSFALSVGVSRKYPLLYSSIQKALDAIPESELAAIRRRWISLDVNPGLDPRTVLALQLAAFFAAVSLAVLIGVALFLKHRLRQSVADLRQSENRYRLIMENSVDRIWQMDMNLVFTYINPTRTPETAYTPEEIKGHSLSEFVSAEDFARFQALLEQVVSEGAATKSVRIETDLRAKTGGIINTEVQAVLLFDEQGAPVGIQGITRDVTERKQAEEALRQASLWLETSVKAGNVGLWDWDLVTNNVIYSPEWKRQIGHEDGEIGNGFSEWESRVHPDDLAPILAKIRAFIAAREPSYRVEFRFRHKDGSYRWILAQASIICDETGCPIRTLGSHMDITERKQAEVALHASEARYRDMFEKNRAVKLLIDPHTGQIVEANSAACAYYGYSHEEMVRLRIWDINAKEEAEVRECMGQAIRGEQTDFVFQHRRASGELREVHVYSGQIEAGDRRLLHSIVIDITERRQAEEALRESEARYRELVENANSIILRMDKRGKITFFNEFAQRFFGYDAAEVIGKNVVGTIVPETDSAGNDLEAMIADIARHPERYALNENENMRRDGTRVWVSWTNRPLYNAAGEVSELLCIGSDVTDRRRAEEALRENESWLRSIFSAAPVGIGHVRDRVLLQVNDMILAMTGYAREELVQQSARVLYPTTEDFAYVGREKYRQLEKTGMGTVETRWRRKDGTVIDVLLSSTYLDTEDHAKGATFTALDITDRKRAESALQEALSELSVIHENAPLLMMLVDRERRVRKVNGAAATFAGSPSNDITGLVAGSAMRCLSALDDPRGCGFGDRCKECRLRSTVSDTFLDQRSRERVETWLPLSTGGDAGEVCLELSTAHLRFDGDERVLVCMQDITERKRAEKALRFNSMVLDQIQDRVTVTDLDGRITYVNEAECRMMQRSREELIGAHVESFGENPARGATQREIIAKTLADGQWSGEVVNYAADGSEVILYCRTQVVRDEQGQAIALCGIATDITERKRAEEALRLANSRLQIAMNSIDAFIYIADMNTYEILFANEYAEETWGRELTGKICWQAIQGLDGPCSFCTNDKLLDEDGNPAGVYRWEFQNRLNGRWYDIRDRAIAWTDGRLVRLEIATDITERKRAEEALRESTERYNDLVAQIPVGVYVYWMNADGTTRFEYVSPRWCEIHQVTEEAVLADVSAVNELVHPEDRESFFAENEAANAKCRPFSWEGRFLIGGETRWLRASSTPSRMDTGDTRWFGVTQDITLRVSAEEALRESEERFSKAFHSSPAPLVISEIATGRFLDANDRWLKMLGYTKEEHIGSTSKEVGIWADPTDRDRLVAMLQRDGRFKDQPVEFKTKDGESVFALWSAEAVTLQGRDVMLSLIFDETERKQAEEELRRRESVLQQVFEVLPIGLWFADAEGRLLRGNPAGVKIWGAEPHVGLSDYSVFKARRLPSGEEIAPDDWALAHTIRDGVTITDELLEIEGFDGKKRIILNYTAPVLDAEGKVEGAIVVNQDITDRQRLQEQLTQAQKMESVGRLAGGVAHDFNNMLGAILGHAELALEQLDLTQPVHDDLIEIRKAAERSAALTRQLLAFARKQTVSPRVIDLNATVEGMLKMLGRLMGEDIELVWKPAENLWPVRVDPSQVDQILANLCVNARDAIRGGGRVAIETGKAVFGDDASTARADCPPGEYVVITVSDNGCGMDIETLAHVFEPFYTTKGVGEGTGLGLATVYGIVKQNEGFIDVVSTLGQGTTFKVYLPRHRGSEKSTSDEPPAKPSGRGHETILLVEDEPAILQISTKILERQGYTVLAASTPGEAIRIAREHNGTIHLLMTDVVMPEMNGRDLAKNIIALYPDMERLFMSGYTADVIAHHGVLDVGVHFLQKPFSSQDLAEKVRSVLDAR